MSTLPARLTRQPTARSISAKRWCHRANHRSRKGLNRSIGTGRNAVVLQSPDISRLVWRNRNSMTIGWVLIKAAARILELLQRPDAA